MQCSAVQCSGDVYSGEDADVHTPEDLAVVAAAAGLAPQQVGEWWLHGGGGSPSGCFYCGGVGCNGRASLNVLVVLVVVVLV